MWALLFCAHCKVNEKTSLVISLTVKNTRYSILYLTGRLYDGFNRFINSLNDLQL